VTVRATIAVRRVLGEPASPLRQAYLDGLLVDARAALGAVRFAEAWAAGEASRPEEAIAYRPEDEASSQPEGGPDAAGKAAPPGPLSRREWEVARLVARGLTNRQIATELIISERTADAHLAKILSKLDFGSRAQVAAWVVQSDPSLPRVPASGGG